jgi:hypothetical protein
VIRPRRLLSCGLAARLFAVVALAVQLAAASVVPWAGIAQAGFDRLLAASICHDAAGGGDQGGQRDKHRPPACPVCPLCQAVAHAGMLLGPAGYGVHAPSVAVLRMATLPPARAPPARFAAAASARGPPVLI